MKSYINIVVVALSCINVSSYSIPSSKTSDRKAFLQTIGASILGSTLNPGIASAEKDKLTDVYFGVG